MATLTPPLKWHGGKHYLASKIIALMPPHKHYVEPYAGGLSVLLAKNPEGVSEVANDLNRQLVNFWQVLACPVHFPRFIREAEATTFSEELWSNAGHIIDPNSGCDDCASLAAAFFVRCRQSLAGRQDTFAPLSRTRTRRGMNEQASAWLTAVEGLPAVHARLKRIIVLNRPALDVIRQQDGPDTLYYLDPPYLHETRKTTKEYGPHEMTAEDHSSLLNAIASIKGKFLLSGYDSSMYDLQAKLHGWKRHDFDLPNNSAGGDTKRRMTECVWTNF